ncbi:uncharacterized protein PHACADRAFT_246031, partial [Phanerochaete carnosa HHB-10118-sp]
MQHFSRFSVSFRVPSDVLGNIGEPLDHGQSEQVEEAGDVDGHCVVDEPRDGLEGGFALQAPGPSAATCREELTGAGAAPAPILRSVESGSEEGNSGPVCFSVRDVTFCDDRIGG